MPDSLQPIQGPASRRERDLDSLLSGEAGYPSVVLGPVAGVLSALNGAPAPDELDGEWAAREAFRLFVRPDVGSTAGLPRAMPSAGPRHRRARHGRARRSGRWPVSWPGDWRVVAAAGSAAAAVIIGVAALAGAFSGLGGHHGPAGQQPTTQAAADTSSAHATSPVLEGGGSSVPPARPTPRPVTQQPTASIPEELCRQYMNFIMHPASANRSAELADIQQLSRLAHGLLRIDGYCAEQFAAAGPGSDPQGGAEAPGPGNQPGHSRDAGVSEPFGGF